MKEHINRLTRWSKRRALGLLLIRIGVGLVFLMHGWQKVHGLPMVEGMFAGFGLPSAIGIFIAWLEVVGGAAMILGVFTRLFGFLFAIEMVVAIFLTGVTRGYRPHELELFLALVSLGVAFAGSGRYSLFAMECQKCGGMLCKGECAEH